ncbi:MAG TPA: hypothetical protein VMW42_05395 [Desulfatiglandales bacterium]|nr:hypothetical protein [Desulfatiglandales bacterium]
MSRIETRKYKGISNKVPRIFYNGLLVLFLLFLSLSLDPLVNRSSARETEETIKDERTVLGTGIIVGQNIDLARNEAISQAFLKAIEEYLVQRLGTDAMSANFQRLDDEILSQAKEGIRDYEIISEFITDKQFRVLLKVQLDKVALEKKLEGMELPGTDNIQTGILFMVSEKEKGHPTIYWWGNPSHQISLTQTELFLSQVFEEMGFRVINRSFFPPEESYDESMLDVNLTNEAAIKWGQLLSAQIILAGEADFQDGKSASVFFKAVKVKDGSIIAQGYREGIVENDLRDEHSASAMELAIKRWANDMIPNILQAVKPVQKDLNHLIVMIRGIKSYEEFLNFKEFLKTSSPQIKSVLERSINKEKIELSVDVKGDLKDLAENLLNHPKKPAPFEINYITDQTFELIIK